MGGGVRKYLANRHILPFYGPLPESVKFLNSEYKAINGAFIELDEGRGSGKT